MFYKQGSINKYVHKNSLLALEGVLLTGIGTVEKLSIEELNSYHSKDKVEEQVDDENIEDVFHKVFLRDMRFNYQAVLSVSEADLSG